jgi:hypothetical protein
MPREWSKLDRDLAKAGLFLLAVTGGIAVAWGVAHAIGFLVLAVIHGGSALAGVDDWDYPDDDRRDPRDRRF